MRNLLNFFHIAGKLKDIERSGWKLHKVKNPESVADHSWRTALMTLVLAKRLGLDENKAVKLALLHDLAEAVIGDYMPDEVSLEQKHFEEKAAIHKLFEKLGTDEKELIGLWEDFEFQKSREGKLVKEVDKLEMALQAKEYEKEGRAKNLQKFIDSVDGHFENELVKKILEEIKGMESQISAK